MSGAEEAAGVTIAAALAKLLDTASNAVQGVDVLVGWAKAQEGITYNSHVFAFPAEAESSTDKKDAQGDEKKSASLASTKARTSNSGGPVISMTSPVVFKPSGAVKPFLLIRAKGKYGDVNAGAGVLQFAIALRQSDDSVFDNGQVILLNAAGFDSAIGSQAQFEFSGQPWTPGRYLLTFNAQVNPLGAGFRRIVGGVIVDKHGELQPHGSWSTGDSSSSTGSPNRAFANNLPWKPGIGISLDI